MTLKVKYSDFQQVTRSRTVTLPANAQTEIEHIANGLLRRFFSPKRHRAARNHSVRGLIGRRTAVTEWKLRSCRLRNRQRRPQPFQRHHRGRTTLIFGKIDLAHWSWASGVELLLVYVQSAYICG
ncbi:hypothetical protein [Mesorhizobium sp. M1328]|uniref:DinB/UmuC family translesion DNA polymerase n=1 Tax=Mesorhizobium sp. M1328 TaxID=2957082 RepID=UPI00333515E3